MHQSHPGASPDQSNEAPLNHRFRPAPTDAEIQAKGNAETATVALIKKQGDTAETDVQAMIEHVMDKADLDAGTCFGVLVPNEMLPVGVAKLLCEIKAEKGLPLEKLPDILVGKMLAAKIEEHTNRDSADKTEDIHDSYEKWRKQFGTNVEAIANAHTLDTHGNQKLEKLKDKLLAFQTILTIAQRSKSDVEIITIRLAEVDLSDPPEPAQFVRAFIFDQPGSHLKTGVSEVTQIAIAQELGIEHPPPSVVTGSDMQSVFEQGASIRRVRDPETGAVREERIPLQPGEFVPIREGQSLGLTETGERALKINNEVGRFVTLLPTNAGPEDLVSFGIAAQMIAGLHEMNMADIFYPGRSLLERGGGMIEVRMPGDFNRSQRLCQIFFGNLAGYDGKLLSQTDLAKIPYLMQFHSAKGDHVIGDINPEQMRADYEAQGIVDETGAVNWRRFEALITANRTGLYVEENFAQTSQNE